MCTDLRLVRLESLRISARTLDFSYELDSTVRVVPRGQSWSAVTPGNDVAQLTWTNTLGFVGMNALGLTSFFADGLNEAGLSVGTLWLPETSLPTAPIGSSSLLAMDFVSIAGWLLGTCRTVADVKSALATVAIWNPQIKQLLPSGAHVPPSALPLLESVLPEHLAIHDADGNDLVVEFANGGMQMYDNHVGVLTNSPTFDWHLTNLRNYVNLTDVNADAVNIAGMKVTQTGNGSGLLGMPGDVTPPSRFVRATVMSEVVTNISDARTAVNEAFHSLEIVSVPRYLVAAGDYTQWCVVRDHGNCIYYVRSYDGWQTDVHDLVALGVTGSGQPHTLPLPAVSR
jgi:choloylglycine hydrolase